MKATIEETRNDLINYLKRECENDSSCGWTDEQIEAMDNEELFRAYCEWEGIGSYADMMISLVSGLAL